MASPIRFTKIVATLGPATESLDAIRNLLRAGCNVVRLNASHGTTAWRQTTLDHVRAASDDVDRHVGVLLDLCGPKIRVARLSADPLELVEGGTVAITRHEPLSDVPSFSTTYPAILDDCKPGQRILLDDGAMALVVRDTLKDRLLCDIATGGTLSTGKGINLPETEVSAPALTAKDVEDLAWGLAAGVDFIGLSFVRRPEDIVDLRRRIAEAGSSAEIVAKIEKPEAVACIERIVAETDALMVARGDLGVEMDVAEVPLIQKRIIRLAVEAGKPVIVATQMLQSMIMAPQPTRAEVSDVANSILDGTDAIMLSGETAVGRYPTQSVAMMDRIANLTEDHERELTGPVSSPRLSPAASGASDAAMGLFQEAALADGAVLIARDSGAGAITVLTHSGATALAVSKRRPDIPIVALSDREDTCRRMALYRGVMAIHHPELISTADVRRRISALLAGRNWVEPDALVVIISGQFPGRSGTSDVLQLCRLGSGRRGSDALGGRPS